MSETRKNIQEELASIAPLLANAKPQQKEAPAFYFEAMQNSVMNKIKEAPAKEPLFEIWLQHFLIFLQPKYAVPAFTIALLFFASAIFHLTTPTQFYNIASEAISEYLIEEDINIENINGELTKNDITAIEKTIAINNAWQNNISEYIFEDDDDFFIEDFI